MRFDELDGRDHVPLAHLAVHPPDLEGPVVEWQPEHHHADAATSVRADQSTS